MHADFFAEKVGNPDAGALSKGYNVTGEGMWFDRDPVKLIFAAQRRKENRNVQ
jgi:hypothetical protein